MAFRLLGALLAGIVLLTAVAPAQAQRGRLLVDLVGPSGVRGQATVVAGGGAGPARLTLEAQGLRPGAEYTAHVHAGTPQRPSASTGALGRLSADAQGRGRLETTSAQSSASGAGVDLGLDWLADGDHFLDLHDGGVVVASGVIPAAPAPRPEGARLPRAGGLPLAVLAGLGLLVGAGALSARARRVAEGI